MRIIVCILLLGFTTLISALRVEPPQVLLCYDNLDFTGSGATFQDMSSVLAWQKTIDQVKYLQMMRFSDAGIALWEEPISLPCDEGYYLAGSSDAIFVVMLTSPDLKVYKYSLNGTAIWPAAGIDLTPSNSRTPYQIILHPDKSGGLWLVANSQSYLWPLHYATAQRLDANGSSVFESGDYVYGGDYSCYLRDSILLEDNSIMLSLAFKDANTLIRIADDGQELFRDNFSNTYLTYEYSSLDSLSGTKLIYAIGRKDFADIYVLSVDGETTVLHSFTLSYEEDAARYVDLTALSATEAILGVRDYAGRALVIRKITVTGDTLYERTLTEYQPNAGINCTIHPTDNGEAYLVYNAGDCCLKVEKISSGGLKLWEEEIISPENYSGRRSEFISACNPEAINVYWMDYRSEASGIYYQSLSASGTPVFPAGGKALVTGSRGFVVDCNVFAIGQNSVVAIFEKADNLSNATLKLVMPDRQPDSSWPLGELIISDEVTGVEDRTAQKTMKVGDSILVLWVQTDSTDHLKAQLISPEGQKMWGAEGVVIYSGEITSFFGTSIEGNLFVAWQCPDGDVYCRKVFGGIPQGSAYCIYDENEGYPMILRDFTSGYCTLTGDDRIRVIRILSDGSLCPAFGSSGLLVPPYFGSNLSCRVLENKLILNISMPGFPPQIYPLIITPEADILYGGDQLISTGYIMPYLKSGYLYVVTYDSGFELAKYNLALECLWTKPLAITVPYEGYISGAIEALNDSTFVLLSYIGRDGYAMQYYFFDEEGNTSMVNLETLYSNTESFSRKYAIVEDGIYIAYYDYENHQWLKTQKIELESQPLPEEELNPTPQVIFGNPYPNPFTDAATIQFHLKESNHVSVSIYNLKGQKITDLFTGDSSAGLSRLVWDGSDSKGMACAKGIYFVRMDAGGKVFTAKLIKLH